MKKYFYLLFVIFVLFLTACKSNSEDNNIKEVEKVSVTFVGNGIEDFEILINKGEKYDLPTPERNGYTFLGWIDTNTGEVVTNEYVFSEDMFLEASWDKKKMYSIYYKYGSAILKDETFYEGDDYQLYQPTLEGYTFVGWYADSDLTKELDLNTSQSTIYAYAKFAPNLYTISFEKSDKTINVLYNNKIGILPTLKIIGCTFEGWTYEGKAINANTIYQYAKDITLTAVLKTKTTFDVDGTSASTIYYIGDNMPYAKVVKDGYIFAGWYLNQDLTGDAIYTIEDESYAGKTLYAKFVSSDDSENTYASKLVTLVASYYEEMYQNKVLYEDISMPSDDVYYGCSLSWSSSDKSAIQNNGAITRTKEDKKVVLSLSITFGNVSKDIDINVTIKGNPYKDIKNSKIVSAYVYTGTYNLRPVDDILLDTVDIINWSFVDPNEDGSITISQDYLTKLEKFQDKAYEKGVRIIMTVSGTGTNATCLANIAGNDEARANFVSNIVDMITKYGFAGVDIDWEYPTDGGSKFTTLITDIYNGVKSVDKELLVTAAIPAGPFSYGQYALKKSNPYMDYINLMSYDMGCNLMYHHTALYKSTMTYSGCSIEESVNNFLSLGVPLDKIIIGAAFYGRKTDISSFTYNSSKGTASGTVNKNGVIGVSMTYANIYNKYINDTSSGAKVYWDSVANANYIYIENTKEFITYESEKSLKAKCEYVKSKGVKGIMWWDYGSDSTGILIEAMNSYLSILK